ncbi:IclR family transcriptional regulator [Opitutus sp. GAS368]|uniref:IclR family transcriptional regulator n=1 Tax=Opitutus sp. GAS368 TaxID=1882749 RepID=UPI00087BDD31|nr:IclR family transcriptional regulator [Opitutus sp. GAS368]SDS06509.1 transcriptional regulator, IclR family [Opitutus sp. GAS368]
MPAPVLPASSQERYVIPNLRNACRILKLLGSRPDGFKIADLGRTLDIPTTTTLRIMTTLHLEGLVRKNGTLYELGPVLIQLGNASLAGTEIRTTAIPVLEKLTGQTDETAHLAISCDDRALIVAVQDSPHPLRAASRPGFLAELHCSSTGKTLLAFLHYPRLAEFYGKGAARPAKRTPHTLTTLGEIKREIELTRKRGYSVDDEEFAPGIRCLAAPVYASDGTLAAAIGITASTVRFTKDRIPEMAGKVQAAASELSRLLGYSAPRG